MSGLARVHLWPHRIEDSSSAWSAYSAVWSTMIIWPCHSTQIFVVLSADLASFSALYVAQWLLSRFPRAQRAGSQWYVNIVPHNHFFVIIGPPLSCQCWPTHVSLLGRCCLIRGICGTLQASRAWGHPVPDRLLLFVTFLSLVPSLVRKLCLH